MSKLREEQITMIVFLMQPQYRETGKLLYPKLDLVPDGENEEEKTIETEGLDFDRDELYIIYEGTVEVFMELEGEITYVIDILSKGAVIRSNHFLVNRLNNIHYRACDRVLLYSL